MKLRTRLLLHGALLPTAGVLVMVSLGGVWFRRSLHQSLDEMLRLQAAVETVSMFDTEPRPHLHLPDSPMLAQLPQTTGTRAIFAADGCLVAGASASIPLPKTLLPEPQDAKPRLSSRILEDGRTVRELTVTITDSKTEARYTLWLAESSEGIEATLGTYARTVAVLAVILLVLLLTVQVWHAESLARRVGILTEHMQRLRGGDLSQRPAPDRVRDELGALRDEVAAATDRLESARDAQRRWLADAAHALKTPLAAMRAQVDVTLRRPREETELRQALFEIRSEVERLGGIASRLIHSATLNAARWELQPVNIAPALKQVVERHRAEAAERGIQLVLQQSEQVWAQAQLEAFEEAISNLVANAVKFSPDNAEVRIEVHEDEVLKISVRDQGPGIPAAEREAVFLPFHRLNANVPGSGLGLAIVREIVERHGGTVSVAPTTGGAELVLALPRFHR